MEKVLLLGKEYKVFEYFREDLFFVLGEERFDYRWIIVGFIGSGFLFYIDFNLIFVWNVVIKGSKKWVLFSFDVISFGVYFSFDGVEVMCSVLIIEWFMNFYGVIKDWKKRFIECVCKAGEVIFVFNGWWYLVINLEEFIVII